ncbi:MAG: hypothetical protein ACK5QJ_22220 [Microcystis sp.]
MLAQFTFTVTYSDRNYPDRDNLSSQWFKSILSLYKYLNLIVHHSVSVL